MKHEIEKHLDENEIIDFMKWGFGESEMIKNIKTFIDKWNSRHKHKLKLFYDGNILEDIPEMINVWKNRNSKI